MGEPMSDKQQNLQDTFLNAVRKSKSAVTIFLVNGVKLQSGNIPGSTTSACCCAAMASRNWSTSTPSPP